ncbi:MAG: type IV pilus assembly protein PilM [Thermoleophilia bacterium]
MSLMSLFGKQDLIGLDIGKSSIVGAQVKGAVPDAALKAYHERYIPDGLVFEGEVVDPEGLGKELKAFMSESRLKGKSVHLGVGNQKVIVRTIEVPEMEEGELRGAIEFQAQDYIPIPIEEVVLDFQVVSRYTDEDGVGKMQVLLVAAQRDMIDGFMEAAKEAGLKVEGIDVSAFALIRALAPQVSFVDQGADEDSAFAIVNISSSVSTLVVALDGVPKFTRIINFAYDNMVGALTEGQGIPFEDAVALLERVGLPGPHEPDEETYNPVTISETQHTLSRVVEELGDELRRSLDYYQSQEYATYIDRVAITGRGAMVRNIDAFLSDVLNVTVELGNPLVKISRNESGQSDEVLAAVAPRLAVALGLALDEVE